MPLVVLMGFALGCARQTGLPHDDSAVSTDAQAVPFDHESHPGGNPSNEFPVTAEPRGTDVWPSITIGSSSVPAKVSPVLDKALETGVNKRIAIGVPS